MTKLITIALLFLSTSIYACWDCVDGKHTKQECLHKNIKYEIENNYATYICQDCMSKVINIGGYVTGNSVSLCKKILVNRTVDYR